MAIADTPKERIYFLVAKYFTFWASISLKRWRPKIIVITGSAGKTTMLHILSAQLQDQAHFSYNANSVYGVSFDILGLTGVTGSRKQWIKLFLKAPIRAFSYTRQTQYYVVEIDGARPGGASNLAKILKPDITAWVSIEKSHAEFFDGQVASGQFANHQEAITNEFMSLPRNTSQAVIINSDSKIMQQAVAKETDKLPKNIIAVSSDYLKNYSIALDKTTFETTNGNYQFDRPVPREVYIQLAMTEEIMKLLDLKINYDLSKLQYPPGRSSVLAGINNTYLVDSTNSTQLASLITTLKMFDAIEHQPKWIVLGDLIELGDDSENQHLELAKYLESMKVEQMILVGKLMKRYVEPNIKLVDKKPVFCSDAHEALDYIKANTTSGEAILFKGSQRMEWIIEKLLSNPEDVKHLIRQSPADKQRRKALGYL